MEGGGFFNSKDGSPEGDSWARRARECHQCSICKRGFTNAQALGGHMNIHRKEGSGGKSSTARAPPAAQRDGAGGDQVHLGLTLGRSQDVDLELRLGH